MSIPIRIPGSGEVIGRITLHGFGTETHDRRREEAAVECDLELSPGHLDHLKHSLRDLRGLLGTGFIEKSDTLPILVTDGGLISYASCEHGFIMISRQLLQDGELGLSPQERRLLIKDLMVAATYMILGERYCRGLHRYVDALAKPIYPTWHIKQTIVVALASLHRFLWLPLEEQVLLRGAYERIEVFGHEPGVYSGWLRELQGSPLLEIPRRMLGRVCARVTMAKDLFPHFVDHGLLRELTEAFVDLDSTADQNIAYDWMVDEHLPTRDACDALWGLHIRYSAPFERALGCADIGESRARDVLRAMAAGRHWRELSEAQPLLEECVTIEECFPLLNELLSNLRSNSCLGADHVRTFSRLLFTWVAEREGVGRYAGDRTEFFADLAHDMSLAGFRVASELARCMAADIAHEHALLLQDRRAEDLIESERRSRSHSKRSYFMLHLRRAEVDVVEIERIIREHLAKEPELLSGDIRDLVAEIPDFFLDNAELGESVMRKLRGMVLQKGVTKAFQQAMEARFALEHQRDIEYWKHDSTELFAIFQNLLVFEEQVPELEDRAGRDKITAAVRTALNREHGVLKGMLVDRQSGWQTAVGAGQRAARIIRQMDHLQNKVKNGGSRRIREKLADAHFRLGLHEAVSRRVPEAITHLRALVRLTVDEEMIMELELDGLGAPLTHAEFTRGNKLIRARQQSLERARVAGAYLELFARRCSESLAKGKRPELEPQHYEKIIDTLELESTVEGREPMYRILRRLPSVVSVAGRDFRLRSLLPAGVGGQAGQMALLCHTFSDEPFQQFMGYKIIQTIIEGQDEVRSYVGKIGKNEHVLAEWDKVFPPIVPDYHAEMLRQRHALPNQLMAQKFFVELHAFLLKQSRKDAELLRPFDALQIEVGAGDKQFPLLLLEYVPGLDDSLPKTIFGARADKSGSLRRSNRQIVQLERGLLAIKSAMRQRLIEEHGVSYERLPEEDIDSRVRGVGAHAACMALLFANVDHQLFTANGQLLAMDYEILFAPCFDPAWNETRAGKEAVSTLFTRRINVAPVASDHEAKDYYAVGELYAEFIRSHRDQLLHWALDSGFTFDEAAGVKTLLVRNAGRLRDDLHALIQCDGTAYLCANESEGAEVTDYGHLVVRPEVDMTMDLRTYRPADADSEALLQTLVVTSQVEEQQASCTIDVAAQLTKAVQATTGETQAQDTVGVEAGTASVGVA